MSIITKQLTQCVQGKRIKEFKHEVFHEGERPLDYTVVLDNLDKIAGTVIKKADSNTLFLVNGYIVAFGYSNGGIRYFPDISEAEIMKKDKNFITSGFAFIFVFDDSSCLVISTNSWTGSFHVLQSADYMPSDKISPYDREKYTLDAFRPHFRKNIGVTAVCVTSKGFLAVDRGLMHEALFKSGIHPKTKASKLTGDEVEILYSAIKDIADDVISAGGKAGDSDLFGQTGTYEYSIGLKAVGNPCPVCKTAIEKASAFFSSIFFCPHCQIEK
ncbi:MAG: hypothetical protein FWD23_10605 [Oscillospiraceae bacterium]|nr:hypothetical protein [Oscillospiraceae bacterium]